MELKPLFLHQNRQPTSTESKIKQLYTIILLSVVCVDSAAMLSFTDIKATFQALYIALTHTEEFNGYDHVHSKYH